MTHPAKIITAVALLILVLMSLMGLFVTFAIGGDLAINMVKALITTLAIYLVLGVFAFFVWILSKWLD